MKYYTMYSVIKQNIDKKEQILKTTLYIDVLKLMLHSKLKLSVDNRLYTHSCHLFTYNMVCKT